MNEKVEAVKSAIQKAKEQAQYSMCYYSSDPSPHVIRDAAGVVVFQSDDRVETVKEYNRLHANYVANSVISAYNKAIGDIAVGKQYRRVFKDGTFTDWSNTFVGLVWQNGSTLEERDVFAAPPIPASFQSRTAHWLIECFGAESTYDKLERADRFIEEILELVQSSDYPKERIYSLIEYVYGREKGEPAQEVGGVMTTLAAYCIAHDLDMHEAGETELARIWNHVDKIRDKQLTKPSGSSLPIATAKIPYGYAVEARFVMEDCDYKPLFRQSRIMGTKKQADICAEDWKKEEWAQERPKDKAVVEIKVVTLSAT